MTRAIVALSLMLFVACADDGDGSFESTNTEPTSDLNVPFPEVDTALPDFDTDTDTEPGTEADTDADSDTELDIDTDVDTDTDLDTDSDTLLPT